MSKAHDGCIRDCTHGSTRPDLHQETCERGNGEAHVKHKVEGEIKVSLAWRARRKLLQTRKDYLSRGEHSSHLRL